MRSDGGRLLALVLAGGEGGRLDVLTAERAKPAMPFAGVYRLVDFPLSNCRHSGVEDVWVLQQYEPHSLGSHLAGGRPWDLDRTHGGLRAIHPYLGDESSGWFRGNADAIHRAREEIAAWDPDVLLVLSADHVYRLDYRDVVESHRASEAAVTIVTTRVPRDEAGEYGVVEVEGERVTGFAYKPDEPRAETVTTEVFAYDARRLLDALAAIADDDEDALSDFGDALLPRLVEAGEARAVDLGGYWKDVGRPSRYWQAHMDLLGDEPALELADPAWPILTHDAQRPPARIAPSARIAESLVSPGARIAGRVERSVLGPGVVVEEGAEVRDAVLFDDVTVEPGARVAYAIADTHVRVGRDARVEGTGGDDDEALVLVGQRAQIAAGETVAAGARVEPLQGHDESGAVRGRG